MEKKFADIINEGKKNGKTVEAINAELKKAGANFHLNPDGGVANWTEAEMAEGFIPAEKEPEDVKHLHDYMRLTLPRPTPRRRSGRRKAITALPSTRTATPPRPCGSDGGHSAPDPVGSASDRGLAGGRR